MYSSVNSVIKSVSFLVVFMICSSTAYAVELQFKPLANTFIKDAVLFTKSDLSCPGETVALGDIDLSTTDHTLVIPLESSGNKWWLVGHDGSNIVYSSNLNLAGAGLFDVMPLSDSGAATAWPVAEIMADLKRFNDQTSLLKFGVMADTHYYSNPYGWSHPLESSNADPNKYDLKSNLLKIQSAFDQFATEGVAFATILGDMVEDHAGWDDNLIWPTSSSFTPAGAMLTNLGDLQALFDQYLYDIHIVIGNHDTGYGATREDIYNNFSYYSKEIYDNNDQFNRMDYTFDVGDIRFIVFDNVNPVPVGGIAYGFRWASPDTLSYLQQQLAKVSIGGVDEGKPVILMSHARIDCLQNKKCSQKKDVTDGLNYKWTKSAGGTNEYYLETIDGSDPLLEDEASHNRFLWVNDQIFSMGNVGILQADRWAYGQNVADPINFDTIYIRFSAETAAGSFDPDNLVSNSIHYKYISEGASENFEEQMAILDNARANGANVLAALAGHHHISDHNIVNGLEYFSFSSPKIKPLSHALVEVLYDGSIFVEGVGLQTSYNDRKPYIDSYNCTSSIPENFSELWGVLANNHGTHTTSDHSLVPTKLWQFGETVQVLTELDVKMHSSGRVYESATDKSVSRWDIYDNNPSGAVVSNVFDLERKSDVIELSGDTYRNGYALRNNKFEEWKDSDRFMLQWSMKFNETYIVSVKVKTTDGSRYLRYTSVDIDALEPSPAPVINLGLGSATQDGQWHTYVRDLKADLALAQPDIEILEVLTFFVQGSGRVDDIKLHSTPPPADTDGDGISDDAEINVYATDYNNFDSDGDGISDGMELIYWGENWNVDSDADGLMNIIDPDSDQDGANDGVEIANGTDPADISSMPPATVYEDAEDVTITRWEIYDNIPDGALVSNLWDAERQSRVIDFVGDNYRNGYVLRDSNLSEWKNSSKFVLEWSMKYSETSIISVKVKTTDGSRYLRYTASNSDGLGSSQVINFGLGSTVQDGQWHTYVRDLKADITEAQPDIEVLEILAFFVQGTGRVDDVKLHTSTFLVETDLDGISNADEQDIYLTNPNMVDTDLDGTSDGAELLYWGSSWNNDVDGDGLVNLLDPDSDNDGFKDGVEILHGSNPADASSLPLVETVFENAEDGLTSRWEIYKNNPAGAVVSNEFDLERQSNVMVFTGDSYHNGYALRNLNQNILNYPDGFVLQWSMKYDELYIITVKVATTEGNRYLRYTAADTDVLGSGAGIYIGLGANTQDGQWHTYVQDLQADLAKAQPSVQITEILAFFVEGSGRVDDIKLYNNFPTAVNPWGNAVLKSFDILAPNSGGLDLLIEGNTAYIASERQGLYILDISNLNDVKVKHHLTQSDFGLTDFSLYSLSKLNNYIYCGFRRTTGALEGYLKIVNLTNIDTTGPVVETSDIFFDGIGGGRLTGLFLDEGTEQLYASLRLGGLALIDLSVPAAPALVGRFDPGNTEHQQVIVDKLHNRAYFGGWFRGIGYVDISDANPNNWSEKFVDDSASNDRYWYVAQQDQYLFAPIADSPSDNSFDEGLAVYDLTQNFLDPTAPPERIGYAPIPSNYQCESATGGKDEGLVGGDPGPHQVYLHGIYAIVGNGCMGIAIFDISDKHNPFFIKGYEIPGQVDYPWSIGIVGSQLIAVGRNRNNSVNNDIYVFDINPATF